MRYQFGAVVCLCGLLSCTPPTGVNDAGQMMNAAPVLSAVSPTSGLQSGGTELTLTGSNFADGATVKVGSSAATAVLVQSKLKITAKTPAATAPGKVSITVTNPDGQSATLASAFQYLESARPQIAEAQVLNDAMAVLESTGAQVSVTINAAVTVPTVTSGSGQGAGLTAQIGVAQTLSSPPGTADFQWSDAMYLADSDGPTAGDKARDNYSATVNLDVPMTGTTDRWLAARFSIDNGATWVLADRDGSSNGFSADQLAKVTVKPDAIDWCKLGGESFEAPPVVTVRQGSTGPVVYAQVYKAGVTDQSGAGAQIRGQLGLGVGGTAETQWAWTDGTFNHDTNNGANDEFQASLPTATVGMKRFAFRFSHNDGPWRYCDADGLTNGFDVAQAGFLTVTQPPALTCQLLEVSQFSIGSGDPLRAKVRVIAAGITDGSGAAPQVSAQIGMGTSGDNASATTAWGWRTANFASDAPDAGGDDYALTFAPAYSGTRAVSARVSLDGGSWVYCDLDGSDVGGYQADQQYNVTVGIQQAIQYCNLQFPFTVSVGALPDGGADIYGQVYLQGVTPSASAPISAEFGWGRSIEDPGLAWQWVPAPFSGTVNNNNEYLAHFAPRDAGLSYTFRYTLDGGQYCYGDIDGSQNGFNGEDMTGAANLGRVQP